MPHHRRNGASIKFNVFWSNNNESRSSRVWCQILIPNGSAFSLISRRCSHKTMESYQIVLFWLGLSSSQNKCLVIYQHSLLTLTCYIDSLKRIRRILRTQAMQRTAELQMRILYSAGVSQLDVGAIVTKNSASGTEGARICTTGDSIAKTNC